MKKLPEVSQHRAMDECDVARLALDWIHGIVKERKLELVPGSEITNRDGIVTLWQNHRPTAMAVLVRDDMNYTIGTFVELAPVPMR